MTAAPAGLGRAARRLLAILDDYRHRPVVVTDEPRARRQLYAMDRGASDRWERVRGGAFNRATLDELADHLTFTDADRDDLPRALESRIRACAVRTVLALGTVRYVTLRSQPSLAHHTSSEDPS